jgi:hypothetical protein
MNVSPTVDGCSLCRTPDRIINRAATNARRARTKESPMDRSLEDDQIVASDVLESS